MDPGKYAVEKDVCISNMAIFGIYTKLKFFSETYVAEKLETLPEPQKNARCISHTIHGTIVYLST